MHDIADLERRGVPSLFVASAAFVDAAAAQAHALGTDPAVVFVAHPIQDRTDEELVVLADDAVEEVVALLIDGR